MTRLLKTAIVLMAFLTASTWAQTVIFRGDVGMVSYVVRAEQAARFELVVNRVIEALKRPADPERPSVRVSLRVLKAEGPGSGLTTYVLLADPVVPSADYSLEHLIGQALPPVEAAEAVQTLRIATEGTPPPVAVDLSLLQSVTPLDALRNRLELDLGLGSRGQRVAEPGDNRPSVDQLRQPLWAIESFEHTVAGRGSAAWRVNWRFRIRNPSLVETLMADVVVEFMDKDGTAVERSRRTTVTIPSQGQQEVYGETVFSAAAASRVVNASVKVDPRRSR